jgi:hypothetical protein
MNTLFEKCAYFEDVSNVQQEHPYSELNGFMFGVDGDRTQDQDRRENHEPDGDDLKEFREFHKKQKNRLNRLKKMRKMHKKLKEMKKEDGSMPTLRPTPFYTSLYGYTGLEGSFDYDLEYYSGSVINEPGAITNNPYNNTYQQASERNVRRILRESFFKSHISA